MAPSYLLDGGTERLEAAIALHGKVFKTDPVIQFCLHTMPDAKRTNYVPSLIRILLQAAVVTGGTIFDEAWTAAGPRPSPTAPPACSAVWLKPRNELGNWRNYCSTGMLALAWNLGIPGLRRMLGEFSSQADAAKKGLRNPDGSRIMEYYYLFFVGTAADQRGCGLGSELIRRFQVMAGKQGVPIWLESTTESSHRLYLRLGFKDVRSWVLGRGKVDRNGKTSEGGEGVRVWGMLWSPERDGKEA